MCQSCIGIALELRAEWELFRELLWFMIISHFDGGNDGDIDSKNYDEDEELSPLRKAKHWWPQPSWFSGWTCPQKGDDNWIVGGTFEELWERNISANVLLNDSKLSCCVLEILAKSMFTWKSSKSLSTKIHWSPACVCKFVCLLCLSVITTIDQTCSSLYKQWPIGSLLRTPPTESSPSEWKLKIR